MPSLENISIIFRLAKQSHETRIALLSRKPRAVQVIQHWLKQADQYCPLLQHLSIKVNVAEFYDPCFVFDCRRQQKQLKTWGVQIWRNYDFYDGAGGTVKSTNRIADIEIVT
jgi:hypothetical protein